MLTVGKVDIFTISEFQLIKTISDRCYNYFPQDYSKYTDTDTVQTDGINHPTELMIIPEYLKVAE